MLESYSRSSFQWEYPQLFPFGHPSYVLTILHTGRLFSSLLKIANRCIWVGFHVLLNSLFYFCLVVQISFVVFLEHCASRISSVLLIPQANNVA